MVLILSTTFIITLASRGVSLLFLDRFLSQWSFEELDIFSKTPNEIILKFSFPFSDNRSFEKLSSVVLKRSKKF